MKHTKEAAPQKIPKFNVPPMRAKFVSRAHLTTRLEAARGGHLTLVRAPAGSGKTMLITEWAQAASYPVLWVNLDESDNDPARFWQYVVRLLDVAYPQTFDAVLTLVQSTRGALPEDVLRLLVDDLAGMRSDMAIVLDDYHLITNLAVHDSVAYLVDRTPPGVHLVISSRSEPPLPLNRLRLRHQLVEIIADDLRFSAAEIKRFLCDVMNFPLADEAIATLEQRTEGWIAGVQLAALSVQQVARQQAQAFINGFHGSQRYIFDYLAEEVLNKQPPAVREFLLHTAILDRFDAPLCDAVTGRKDSQQQLDALETANLFLVPLDLSRKTYRYHHLFADFLRARLRHESPDMLPELHRRASDWYESHHRMQDVVKHRLAMEDYVYAAEVVNRIAYEMLAAAEDRLLLGWLESLPENLFDAHPQLRVVQTLVLSASGLIDTAEERLDLFEQQAETIPDALRGIILTVRSNIASMRGDVAKVLEYTHKALEYLPETDVMMRVVNMVTTAAYTGGSAALRLLHEALQLTGSAENRLMRITVMGNLSRFSQRRGDLSEAVRIYREALQIAAEWEAESGRALLSTYYIHTGLAEALYRLGSLDSAAEHAAEGLRLSKLSGDVYKSLATYLSLAQIHRAHGARETALETLREAETFSQKTHIPFEQSIAALQTQFGLAELSVEAAQQWLNTQEIDKTFTRDSAREYFTHAWALVVAGRADEALGMIENMLETHRDEVMVDLLTLKAVALEQTTSGKQALDTLAEAVSHGFAAKDIWGIAQFGQSVQPLIDVLLKAQRRGQYRDIGGAFYTVQVLRAIGGGDGEQPTTWPMPVKPLSERELEVLRLMAQGMTNPEIAQRLSISKHTVGNHVCNIYDKLTVANRMQAVLRARELDLI